MLFMLSTFCFLHGSLRFYIRFSLCLSLSLTDGTDKTVSTVTAVKRNQRCISCAECVKCILRLPSNA